MFGKNPVRKADLRADGSLQVKEIFATLQGEGPLAGEPAIFVRLSGCNLNCWFCDTDFEGGERYLPAALVDKVVVERDTSAPGASLIVLTGGEPLRQNVVPFIDRARMARFKVQIETAGTLGFPGWMPGAVLIVCSPKTGKIQRDIEQACHDYKYIVSARDGVDEHGIPFLPGTKKRLYFPDQKARYQIWLQPCDEQNEDLNGANRELCVKLCMQHGYRLSLQQHKALGLR